MTASFRRQWLGTVPLGLLDACLHATAAWLLPGPWWLQYLPDVVVPVLWLRSMRTNRMAAEDSFLLWLHRVLHCREVFYVSVLAWLAVSMHLALLLDIPLLLPPLHVAVHVAIDKLTHGKEWQ